MALTLKQKEKAVKKAIKNMDAAADSMVDLLEIMRDYGVKDTAMEDRFRSELRERASYWDRVDWWKK